MSSDRSTHDGTDRRADSARGTTSRRTFLRATAAGAAAGALATGPVGTAAGEGIPTPFLEQDGNLIRNSETGEQVILRGVSIADPRRIDATAPARGKTTEQTIQTAVEDWYARVIRLPVHPGDVAGLPPIPESDEEVHMPPTFDQTELETYCEQYLDPAVDACEEMGAYAIVDYHRHWGEGALEWNDEQLSEEVHDFWEVVADKYGDRDHVIFELYNEPTYPGLGGTPLVNDWSLGRWEMWRDTAQPWLDTVRQRSDNLTIIGSPNWSQYPEGGVAAPFDGDNLGYTYHIYPNHSISGDGDWDGTIDGDEDQDNGQGVYECYEEIPLFVTEFGWHEGSGHPMEGTTEGFGVPFHDWLEDKPIHWTAWCFDPTWLPSAVRRPFETGDSTDDSIGDPYNEEIPEYCEDLPCEWEPRPDPNMGVYTKEVLYQKRNDDVPTGGGGSEAPDAPSDSWTNEVTATSVDLGWSAVDDATHYNVYVDDGLVGEPTGTSYTVTGLDPATTYVVGLSAENGDGESDRVSTEVTTESGGDCPAGTNGEATVEGRTVCSVYDDGYYRDFNADGSVTQADVTEFFTVQHKDGYQNAPGMFDYNGNDSVGLDDVVYLFQEL